MKTKNYNIMEILLIIFILYTIFGRKKDEKKKKKKESYWGIESRHSKKYWDDVNRWIGTR